MRWPGREGRDRRREFPIRAQAGRRYAAAEPNWAAQLGFTVEVVAGGDRAGGIVVSSSEIRRLMESGRRVARRPLARAALRARRARSCTGHGIGSKQTVPTLNLRTQAEVLPADGVYITRTQDRTRDAGIRSPTSAIGRPSAATTNCRSRRFCSIRLEGATPAANSRRVSAPRARRTEVRESRKP